jgi:hypothetical protein
MPALSEGPNEEILSFENVCLWFYGGKESDGPIRNGAGRSAAAWLSGKWANLPEMEFGCLAAFNSRSALPLNGDPQCQGALHHKAPISRTDGPECIHGLGTLAEPAALWNASSRWSSGGSPPFENSLICLNGPGFKSGTFGAISRGWNHSNLDLIDMPFKIRREDCEQW